MIILILFNKTMTNYMSSFLTSSFTDISSVLWSLSGQCFFPCDAYVVMLQNVVHANKCFRGWIISTIYNFGLMILVMKFMCVLKCISVMKE